MRKEFAIKSANKIQKLSELTSKSLKINSELSGTQKHHLEVLLSLPKSKLSERILLEVSPSLTKRKEPKPQLTSTSIHPEELFSFVKN